MPRSPHRPIVECPCCGVKGMATGQGWIDQCYDRWSKAGRPPSGPPQRLSDEERRRLRTGKTSQRIEDNLEELMFVLKMRKPITIEKASILIGVHPRTGSRYMKRLRERGFVR